MKVWLIAGVALMVLSGCGGTPEAVGENSAGSIKTTAVGEVVVNAAAATPTPTPTPTAEATDATSNAIDAAGDDAGSASGDDAGTTTH